MKAEVGRWRYVYTWLPKPLRYPVHLVYVYVQHVLAIDGPTSRRDEARPPRNSRPNTWHASVMTARRVHSLRLRDALVEPERSSSFHSPCRKEQHHRLFSRCVSAKWRASCWEARAVAKNNQFLCFGIATRLVKCLPGHGNTAQGTLRLS
jgi:hypothetical protein